MVRSAIAALALLLAALPISAREAPGALRADGDPRDLNPLAGYRIQLAVPAAELIVEGDLARQPDREATLLLDGRAAAILPILGGEATLPHRRWTAGDWLKAGGGAAVAAALGYLVGWVAGALR